VSPKVQAVAKRLVTQLHMVLRTMRIHDPGNQALLVATAQLEETINSLFAALGGIRLQFIEGQVFLNDTRLRFEPALADGIRSLEAELAERGLGGIGFSRPVDAAGLRELLQMLARPVGGPEDAARLVHNLSGLKNLALELLGPRSFADTDSSERELRVDRRTFALQTYAKAVVCARECLAALKAGADPLGGKLHITRIVQDLVDIASDRVNLLLRISAIKRADEYAFNHAANTCLLSIAIGKALEIDRVALVDLGTSAFLADMGFSLLPPELLQSSDSFGEREKVEVRSEMIRTLRILMGRGRLNDSVLRRVLVAFEHHGHFVDPAKGTPSTMHLFSRIVAVADAYDALTTQRPWREGYAADEALQILDREAGTRFDPALVKVLTNLLGVYPLGSIVRLGSGEIALVYHNSDDPRLFEKPWVKVIRDPGGAPVRRTVIRNLAESSGEDGRILGFAKELLREVDPGALLTT
jgi:hypothetical protein